MRRWSTILFGVTVGLACIVSVVFATVVEYTDSADTINFKAGDDAITFSTGSDTIDFGAGTDYLDFGSGDGIVSFGTYNWFIVQGDPDSGFDEECVMGFSKDCGLMATDQPSDARAGVLVRREASAPTQRALLSYYTHAGGPTYYSWVEANSDGEAFMGTDAGNEILAASDGDVVITLGN